MNTNRLISHLEKHRENLPPRHTTAEFSSLPYAALHQLFLLLPDSVQAQYRAELGIPTDDRPLGHTMEGGIRPD